MSDGVRRPPRYRDLPIDPSKPAGSAWGVFGPDDQVGTINLLTEERVRAAAQLVRAGAVFSLNWDLEKPGPAILSRGNLKHSILKFPEGTDDHYDSFYTQASSQWDALCHIQHPTYGFYNGVTFDDITGVAGSRNGIDNWARRGIAGRFVLADMARYFGKMGQQLRADEPRAVTVDEIDAALAAQRVRLSEGDILLLRFGWIGWYEGTDAATRKRLSEPPYYFPNPGLAPEERTAAWVWDHQLAAVVGDNPGLEVYPCDPSTIEGMLHYRLIPLLGVAIGEMFVLDSLAAHCDSDGVYEGLFVAAPLNKVGGSGSPANALALK
jgi:kynurenine formamidase